MSTVTDPKLRLAAAVSATIILATLGAADLVTLTASAFGVTPSPAEDTAGALLPLLAIAWFTMTAAVYVWMPRTGRGNNDAAVGVSNDA